MSERESLIFLINHVFLPPKLPPKNDFQQGFGHVFADYMLSALRELRGIYVAKTDETDILIDTIHNFTTTHDAETGELLETELRGVLKSLSEKGGYLPLYVKAQNAGMLVSKTEKHLTFQMFELSPLNEAVMSTKGRLLRSFPGSAIGVDLLQAGSSDFMSAVAQTLALMSHQPVSGMQPEVKKVGEMIEEDRDTTHPAMVTEYFNGFLAALGTYVDVPVVGKNTREDVLWSNAEFPWRRSAMWLLLKVSLQLCCAQMAGSVDEGNKLYKTTLVFFMSSILKAAEPYGLSTELLHVTRVKISRRLLKLSSGIDESLLRPIGMAIESNADVLRKRWAAIQQVDSPELDLDALSSLNFDRDRSMILPDLDAFIESATSRRAVTASVEITPESDLILRHASILPHALEHRDKPHLTLRSLHSCEVWVQDNLSSWVHVNQEAECACGMLADFAREYYFLAERTYGGDPESWSIMVLTLLELWAACDKIAIGICSFLDEYSPGIPCDALQNLLLPFQSQMARLHDVEVYLGTRNRSIQPAEGAFQAHNSNQCFAARYFDQSRAHQTLLNDIRRRAEETRDDKIDQLSNLKAKYETLMRQHIESLCESYLVEDHRTGQIKEQHSNKCKRCSYKAQAEALTIDVHEWPLPDDAVWAKVVVFELQVPRWYGNWRDLVMFLRLDVMKAEYASKHTTKTPQHLSADRQLKNRFRCSHTGQRLELVSSAKPHLGTHRRGKRLATSTVEKVCLRSGLRYYYYDSAEGCFVDGIQQTDNVPWECTYDPPTKAIRKYMFRTVHSPNGPSPNTVIAEQSRCPREMTLSDWKALCSIPLGFHLQYWNIAMQLRMPVVDLQRMDTVLVCLQCMYQAGPTSEEGDVVRLGHQIVQSDDFARTMLTQLHQVLDRVKENWSSSNALYLFGAIARRLLSLHPSNAVKDECMAFLQAARAVALDWVKALQSKAADVNDDDRGKYIVKAAEMSLICASTLDIDRQHLGAALSDVLTASTLVQCCIAIHQSERALATSGKKIVRHWLSRHTRLLYDTYRTIAGNQEALHDAVSQSWAAYQPGNAWTTVENASHWVSTSTSPEDSNENSIVHYDLLSGTLLVNGQPVDRLPKDYETHVTYGRLFGHSTVEVMPATARGLRFSAKTPYRGHVVQFGVAVTRDQSTTDLLVQASQQPDGPILELVPPRLFQGWIAPSFVDEYVHWFNTRTGQVEFHPADNPWNTCTRGEWRMMKGDDSKWRLARPRDDRWLVTAKSRTASVVAGILSPLAQPSSICLTVDKLFTSLDVSIPDLRIGFGLTRGKNDLSSREFPGMRVSEVQSIGTLIGLKNKLVLKHTHTSEKKILVLEGRISCKPTPEREHVEVRVDLQSPRKTHCFCIDPGLGALSDNGSLQSKLLLAYLHACTAYCEPDPFTRHSGTEEALEILESAAVRSFSELSADNVDLLCRIRDLTPKRTYYPDYEKVMQSVQWSPGLSLTSQHDRFFTIVESIFDHARRYDDIFYQSGIDLPNASDVDKFLLERSAIRSAVLYVSGYGAETHTSRYDMTYAARDRNQASRRRAATYMLSGLVCSRHETYHSARPSATALWNTLQRSRQVLGPGHHIDVSELRYDAGLVHDGGILISQAWPSLHRMLARGNPINEYSFMLWLSAIACSGEVDRCALETVAMFRGGTHFSEIYPPSSDLYDVSNGHVFDRPQLEIEIRGSLRVFHECPEAHLSKRPHESRSAFGSRRYAIFQSNQAEAIRHLLLALAGQWPCEMPQIPTPVGAVDARVYIDTNHAIRAIRSTFADWYHNRQLFAYLEVIEHQALRIPTRTVTVPKQTLPCPRFCPPSAGSITIGDLFRGPAPFPYREASALEVKTCVTEGRPTTVAIESLIAELRQDAGSSTFERRYVDSLQGSIASMPSESLANTHQLPSQSVLRAHWKSCRGDETRIYGQLECHTSSITRDRPVLKLLENARQWPRISPKLFLQQLARHRWCTLSPEWKACLVQYGCAITLSQRAARLLKAASNGIHEDMIAELSSEGHVNWDPVEYPERLLLEVESNILIRDVQIDIANRMADPPSECNTSMQLNMGEGKSSVIAPIVAATLADGSRLARIVVGKPQSKQMAQMLISTIGGMINRRVYFMPFSRKVKLDADNVERIRGLYRECMDQGGVVLLQPENILSFQLMTLERSISGRNTLAISLSTTQAFFDRSARDIVDESDENFDVKFELVYSMGTQQHIDGGCERWSCLQEVLDLVAQIAPEVVRQFPSSMEVQSCSAGGFPRIRILGHDAEAALLERVARKVCETGLSGFPIARQTQSVRQAVFLYITKGDLSQDEIDEVERSSSGAFWNESIQPRLFMLRGLLACGLLTFVFSRKRWRVDYGLDMDRRPATRLAVPYKAKDMPTYPCSHERSCS